MTPAIVEVTEDVMRVLNRPPSKIGVGVSIGRLTDGELLKTLLDGLGLEDEERDVVTLTALDAPLVAPTKEGAPLPGSDAAVEHGAPPESLRPSSFGTPQ